MSNDTNINYMLQTRVALESDLSHWNVGKVQDKRYMFYGCVKMEGKLPHWYVT